MCNTRAIYINIKYILVVREKQIDEERSKHMHVIEFSNEIGIS